MLQRTLHKDRTGGDLFLFLSLAFDLMKQPPFFLYFHENEMK